jgi:poly-gamma-glutamate synthesis protein (capsule biosynthesis protein)
VRAAKQLAKIVIASCTGEPRASPARTRASWLRRRRLAAAGADIIIGSHALELQGSGWLGYTFVAYGMGNFLWWENSCSAATWVLELTLHPNAPLTEQIIPAVVSPTGQPIVLTGAAAHAAAAQYASLRTYTDLPARRDRAGVTDAQRPRTWFCANPGRSSFGMRCYSRRAADSTFSQTAGIPDSSAAR